MKYIRDLSKADDKIMSVSPQEHKENRPFVGIIVVLENKKYCIPLTSPKEKHKKMKNDVDFSKILDKNQNIIGALNFNNMIPVSYTLITPIDITPKRSDTPNECIYKTPLNNQLDWCNDNYDNITKKANKLYEFVTKTPEKSYNLVSRCCDFQKLEKILEKWLEKEFQRCNDVLDRNPVLKSKLDAAATKYNRRHNLSRVFIFSFSNIIPIPRAFSSRTYFNVSTVFRAKRDIDLVRIRSIFRFRHSLIISINSSRFLSCVPEIPSSAKIFTIIHLGFFRRCFSRI